jgi:polyphosphate kinase 2 (PPK2 family)
MNTHRGEMPSAERDGKYYAEALVARVMDNITKKGHMDELIISGLNEFHSGNAEVNEEAKSLFKEMMIAKLTEQIEYWIDLSQEDTTKSETGGV